MSKLSKTITLIACFSLLIVIPFFASAKLVPCGQTDAPKCQLCHIFLVIRNVITLALEITIPLAALFIVIGGITILTSTGSSERTTYGKKIISYAVIGIVVVFTAWIIVNSVIVLLVNPNIFPGPWNAWKLSCPTVIINPENASTTSYTVLKDADSSGNASPGDTLRYSLTYTNTSDTNLSNLVLTSDYDQNHIFAIFNISNNGTDDGDKITWQIDKLKTNESITLTYDFVLTTDFSDLLGKTEKPNLFTKILNKISEFFNKKALAQAQTIYLQNIITISSNQAETATINNPITLTVSTSKIAGDPQDIPNNPDYLAGYYEEPDDSSSKWPSYDWYFDQLAKNDNNAVRLLFYNPKNPFYSISPWVNNDCSRPNDDFYTDWLKPTINKANSRGIYVILTLYFDDWTCDDKTQENRNKTYNKIINDLNLPKDKVIIEINWEPPVNSIAWMQDQAKYFEDRRIPTIITDEHYNENEGATNSVSTYAGRHREWDRETSLRYFDAKPTIWTERMFTLAGSPSPYEEMTRFQARENIYQLALTAREPILFYYLRWSTPDEDEPDLPKEYLEDVGYAVKLARKIPWKEMVPQERYNKTVGNKGYWAIKDNEAVLGWVNKESEIKIDITGWRGEYNYWWYDPGEGPGEGKFNYIDTISGNPISQTFTVSTPDSSKDWVFVLKGLPPPTHKECINNQCVVVQGAGVDQCSSVGADCGVPDKYVFIRARYPDQCTQQPCQYGLSITSLRSEGCITAVCLHTRECWWNWHAEEYANYTVSPSNSKDWEVVKNVCNALGLPVPANEFVCNRGAVISRYDSLIPENETHGINNYECTNVPLYDCPTGKAPLDVWGVCNKAHSFAAGPSHKECVNNSCIKVENAGANQCSVDANCVAPTLSVTLSANPSSGNVPLNGVVLTADVSGTATGTINYTFYCNRSDAGTNITPGYAHKLDATNSDPYSVPAGVCDSVYTASGTYTAKVIVERGGLAAKETRATITVSTTPTGTDYWLWGIRSCDSTIPCQTYCDNAGADYCVRGMANCEGGFYNLQILHEGETGCTTARTGDYECSFREAGACIDVSCRCGNY